MLNLNDQGQHLTQIAISKQPICPPPMPVDPRFWPPASDEPKESSSGGTEADSKPWGKNKVRKVLQLVTVARKQEYVLNLKGNSKGDKNFN